MSYADKKRSPTGCHWPSCQEAGTTLALDPRNCPQWFCPDHASILAERRK